jgi:hypothetical protein
MYRKKAVIDVGGYRKMFEGAEDYDLWMRLSKVGELSNLEGKLTHYRISENQVTRKNSRYQAEIDNCVRLSYFISSTGTVKGKSHEVRESLNGYYDDSKPILLRKSINKYRLLLSSEYMNSFVSKIGSTNQKKIFWIDFDLWKSLLFSPYRATRYLFESYKYRAIRKIKKSLNR